MARNLRVEFPGAIYHVTVRMIGDWQADRSRLFRDFAEILGMGSGSAVSKQLDSLATKKWLIGTLFAGSKRPSNGLIKNTARL